MSKAHLCLFLIFMSFGQTVSHLDTTEFIRLEMSEKNKSLQEISFLSEIFYFSSFLGNHAHILI
ncbi:hypothetical protein D7I46_02205 [Lactococcus allomyrinae]|uniref:Uncharacterized protein n=1 Tax=Lactococcus allomyrinae TaxID=2419773 RepID=A0A387BCC3_9LACT|nr:hypothetical protein D7I46_02205 [Lactococcus allomyrinae]